MIRTKRNSSHGQGMTEYLIIVALIAVTAIAVVRTTGANLKVGFAKISAAITGQRNNHEATEVSREQVERRTMKDFGKGAI